MATSFIIFNINNPINEKKNLLSNEIKNIDYNTKKVTLLHDKKSISENEVLNKKAVSPNVQNNYVEEKGKIEKNNYVEKENKNQTQIVIPQYKIERIERLSGAFEQGKIFITVNENTNSKSLRGLCEKIFEDYNEEFSNLIICIYSDSVIGKDMALGQGLGISKEIQQKTWLAMYTYNHVEGAYFDDNPGGYLGAY